MADFYSGQSPIVSNNFDTNLLNDPRYQEIQAALSADPYAFATPTGQLVTSGSKVYADGGYFEYTPTIRASVYDSPFLSNIQSDPGGDLSQGLAQAINQDTTQRLYALDPATHGGAFADARNWKWVGSGPAPDLLGALKNANVTATEDWGGGALGQGGLNALIGIAPVVGGTIGSIASGALAGAEDAAAAGALDFSGQAGQSYGGSLQGQILNQLENPLAVGGEVGGGSMGGIGSYGLDFAYDPALTAIEPASFSDLWGAGNYMDALGTLPWSKILPTAVGAGTALGGMLASQSAADTNAAAIRDAANTSAAANQQSLALYEKMYNDAIARNEPYSNLGLAALRSLQSGDYSAFPSLQNTEKLPLTYDEVVANYDVNNPAYAELQRQSREATNQQLSARGMLRGGVGANILADQERKLAADEFEKKRAADQQRYAGLLSDYNLRKAQTTDQYNKLLDMIKMGQGAASTAGQYSNQYATNIGNLNTAAATNAANSALAQASNTNAATSNTINSLMSGAGLGLKAYSTFNPSTNYWGGSTTPTTGLGTTGWNF